MTSASSFNVLISSAGRRVALLDLFRRALRDLGLRGEVMAADMSRLSSAFHAADKAFEVPTCDDPVFVPVLLQLCRDANIDLIVPTIDPELGIFARSREAFREIGATVAVSSPEVIEIAEDKVRTHDWLRDNGFPTVRQERVAGVFAEPDRWGFPLLVKPRRGSAARGVAAVRDRDQLRAATRDDDFVVQSIAPGDEYTIDVLADRHGRALCAVPRRRFEVRSGEVSKGMTVRSPALEDLARRVCEALPGAYGPVTVQVFQDAPTGETNVIEINPRFGGGFPLSWQAGARYPVWLIEEAMGRPSTASSNGWADGTVMLRYDEAVFTTAEEAGV